jgi:hypothetical protein
MVFRTGLVVLGLFSLVNGLLMLAAPQGWYGWTPGVPLTGPMNPHFIRDIGLAFVASGAGLLAGARSGQAMSVLGLSGAAWPALHALFHVSLWPTQGFPRGFAAQATEVIGGVGLGVFAAWFALARAKQEGVI